MNGRAETQFLPDQAITAIKPDVIVLQRQAEDEQVETIKRYKAAWPDAFVVFEIDDALSAVPEKSWHAPYMTPNIDAKLQKAVRECDVVTVTTEDLAAHMRQVCDPGTKIRVVPNMLGRDDMESCEAVRRQLQTPAPGGLLRVGWGGGIGHIGDLEMLTPVFEALKTEVEWVFLGMDPKLPEGCIKHYMGSTPPDRYLVSLAALNVDLMIAPLEDNLFNKCKSNLRLLEAGACKYPVIATDIAPYRTNTPPIEYANSTEEWIAKIREFAAFSKAERHIRADLLHKWVSHHYVMDSHAESRIKAWLPDHTNVFKPKLNDAAAGTTTVHTDEEFAAALKTTNNILYLRPGAVIQEDAIARLTACDGDIVCGLSNDGGPWGFPSTQQFTHLDPIAIAHINSVCKGLTAAALIDMAAISGPCVFMTRKAISACGFPPVDLMSLEMAILDWSVCAKAHGLSLKLCPSVFTAATQTYGARSGEAESAQIRITSCWPHNESDEASLRALREEMELRFHKDTYRAIPPQNRSDYNHWWHVTRRGDKNTELAYTWLENAFGGNLIPTFGMCNYPCDKSSILDADYILCSPANSIIPDDAFVIIAESILNNPNSSIFYADHDFLTVDGKHDSPDFKPHVFDYLMALSRDYLTQSLVIPKSMLDELPDQITQADLFKLVLNHSGEKITHVARVLATLPPINAIAMIEVANAEAKIVQEHLVSLYKDTSIAINAEQNATLPMLRNITFGFNAQDKGFPKVSIIVPSRDNLEMLAPCVQTVLDMTAYPNFELIIVDNGSTRKEFLDYIDGITGPRVRIIKWDHDYNWAEINNMAVKESDGEFVCTLNDDTRVLSPGWLSEMVGAALIPNVGAAGARLLYPHGLIQHVGVVANAGMNGHIHKGLPANNPGNNAYAIISHEATAVTAACLVVARSKFNMAGGFPEILPTNFNDVAFCLALRKMGLVNVVCAGAELQHFEGITRNKGGKITSESLAEIQRDGAVLHSMFPDKDPYWNPNLLFTWVQNGQMVAGTDMNAYEYPAPEMPWGKPEMERVLVIGDDSVVAEERANLNSIYHLTVVGHQCQILSPMMANAGPWDTRVPTIAAAAFKKLGIDRIVLSTLGEMPLSTLSFLTALDLPVEYRPVNAEAVCPRFNLMPNTLACDQGYKHGICQACMETNSSPHGNVVIPGYLAEWIRFFNRIGKVDLAYLEKGEYRTALETLYGGSQAQAAE